jgi:hypothetical protein
MTTDTPPTLYSAYTAPRRSDEAEADLTALVVIKTLHAQSGKPVTLAALASEFKAMGLPPARRARPALIEAMRRMAEAGAVTLVEAPRTRASLGTLSFALRATAGRAVSAGKPLACVPTSPNPRVPHTVRESVTFAGGVQFIRCETCGVSLAREAGMEYGAWEKRKTAFRKRHPATVEARRG